MYFFSKYILILLDYDFYSYFSILLLLLWLHLFIWKGFFSTLLLFWNVKRVTVWKAVRGFLM